MLLLKNDRRTGARMKSFVTRFARDEDGGIIILTIVLLITMLVVGGMAVDFMRFESRRAMLQSVADRSVLAAAELDQTLDPADVVVDFFDAAGYPSAIIGTPDVNPGSNSRSVSVSAAIDVNTFYLRLIGIDTLSAPARASAVEGIGNVEVSLVLDISGSMRSWVASESATRMDILKEAAQDFVDDLLLPQYEDQISISLVSYSQQVAIGDIYYQLRTTPDTVFEDTSIAATSSFVTTDEFGSDPSLDVGTSATIDPSLGAYYTNPARCIDFDAEDYNTLTFDRNKVYKQVEFFEHFTNGSGPPNLTVCPKEDYQQIIPLSQDADELKDAIELFEPTTYTSIHLGMKWGASLLDPSTRDLLDQTGNIDEAFSGFRPADYDDTNTVKYLVLMTDGQNVRGERVEDAHYWDGDSEYSPYEWQVIWSQHNVDYWRNSVDPNNNGYAKWQLTDVKQSASRQDTWLQQLCNLADDEMTIFTIAMGAGTHGTEQMRQCASDDAFAFSTNLTTDSGEPGIDEIFDAIARQITALRLNL